VSRPTSGGDGTSSPPILLLDRERPNTTATTVRALPLRTTARAIATNSGQKGAIVITFGQKGIHVGSDGLGPDEVREALCTAIHASYLFDGED
jgi:hypothetical protein